ncbi:glycosyltransferase family 4 protein [Tenacibaculum amylolyticum]|uniref:glycosyltransferase family 4 protein n=1 Tax=Tenacibaculum amylolyticum TaxID=104269 RepID=UPI003894CC50
MKIGMILDDTFPPDPRVENEAIELIKEGHEVFLFCLTYGEQKLEEKINGIEVKRYPSTKLIYKLSALAYTIPVYSMIMKKKIVHFLTTYNIEAIHCHDIRVAEAVFWANKKLKLPVVLDMHDNLPDNMKYYPHLQKFPGKYIISPKKWKEKEAVFMEKATKIVSVSQEFVDELIERTQKPEKFLLVPNTVNAAFYNEAVINNEIIDRYRNNFSMLYLGDTNIRRGLLTAIDAIPALKESIPSIKLVIVGSNTTDYILKKRVAELGIEAYVDFQGWQDLKLFPSYILASDICISPLHRSKQHDVAYANKIFQYMSLAKPVLASDAIAQKKLIEKVDSGLIFEDKNIPDFIEKTIELFESEDLRKRLGANGEDFIKNDFNWSVTAKNLITLYNNIN